MDQSLLKDYLSTSYDADNDGFDDLSPAESIIDDEEDIIPQRKPPIPPPRPLTSFDVMMQVCLNDVGIVHPHRNSLHKWDEFFDVLAERVAFMEKVMTQFKYITAMREIYEDKKRLGDGVPGWKQAFKLHRHRITQMAQNVLNRK